MKYFRKGGLADIALQVILLILVILMAQTAQAKENGTLPNYPTPTWAPTKNPWGTNPPLPTPTEAATLEPYPAPPEPYPAPENLVALVGNCGTGWVAKDENAPFEYNGDQIIDKVIIKASTECFTFKFTGSHTISSACYVIFGIGTNHVTVFNAPNPAKGCHDISHVEFYASKETATPTDVPRHTPTNTATLETPFKFWTFTPTVVTDTPTPPTGTPEVTLTGTPPDTLTATPPDTLPPPPPRKTKTPQVLLPMTGEDNRALGTEELQWLFAIVFIGAIVFFCLVVFSLGKRR